MAMMTAMPARPIKMGMAVLFVLWRALKGLHNRLVITGLPRAATRALARYRRGEKRLSLTSKIAVRKRETVASPGDWGR